MLAEEFTAVAFCTVTTWIPSDTPVNVAWKIHVVGRLPNQGETWTGLTAKQTTELGSRIAVVLSSVVDDIVSDEDTLEQSIGVEK